MRRFWTIATAAALLVLSFPVQAQNGEETQPAARRLAHMRLSGEVLGSPPSFTLFGDGEYMTLQDWLHRLSRARRDPEVAAVAIDIDSPEMSLSQAQELADAVVRLKEVKPVYAYLNSPKAAEHLVASGATEIAMDEADMLNIVGVGAEMFFFGKTLGKIGLQPQMVQIGRYKGAAEPVTSDEPSQYLKEQYDWILDDLFDQLVEQISSMRRLSRDEARKAIDMGPLEANQAVELHMVDRLCAKVDWLDRIGDGLKDEDGKYHIVANYGKKEPIAVDASNPFALLNSLLRGSKPAEAQDPTIAIIHVDGVIVPGDGGETLLGQRVVGASAIMGAFRQATEDERIKAVVFRIDSPGGSALASEQIYNSARKCAKVKPVIASIGQVGASGGYYIAVAGDSILADPAAITGSIGVVSGKIAITELLDKIGVGRYEATRGRNAGLWLSRPWTAEELQVIERHANQTYDLFVKRVKDGRGTRIGDIEAVAQGRIFTARQAAANGLIDRIGGLREAVALAQDAAGVEEPFFLVLPRARSLADVLSGREEPGPLGLPGAMALLDEPALRLVNTSGAAYMMEIARLLQGESVLLAMPEYLLIKQ